MIRIEEYIVNDRSPFRDWLERLDPQARVMIAVAIERLADGNTSNVKSIGEGAAELKINRGPGYRVYFRLEWQFAGHSVGRRHQAETAKRHRCGAATMAGLQVKSRTGE
ncbi:putative addiction module killer protein [Bradyrhizobium ottawaense]|uniref:type II toxin-antitoxin system RelE/ParE family toxin n=1 Tax=Bradyrhizobium ottawaense TaxID=931866 RepID=UPI0035186ADC